MCPCQCSECCILLGFVFNFFLFPNIMKGQLLYWSQFITNNNVSDSHSRISVFFVCLTSFILTSTSSDNFYLNKLFLVIRLREFVYLSKLFAGVSFLIKYVPLPQVLCPQFLNKCVTISVGLESQNIKLVGDDIGWHIFHRGGQANCF